MESTRVCWFVGITNTVDLISTGPPAGQVLAASITTPDFFSRPSPPLLFLSPLISRLAGVVPGPLGRSGPPGPACPCPPPVSCPPLPGASSGPPAPEAHGGEGGQPHGGPGGVRGPPPLLGPQARPRGELEHRINPRLLLAASTAGFVPQPKKLSGGLVEGANTHVASSIPQNLDFLVRA